MSVCFNLVNRIMVCLNETIGKRPHGMEQRVRVKTPKRTEEWSWNKQVSWNVRSSHCLSFRWMTWWPHLVLSPKRGILSKTSFSFDPNAEFCQFYHPYLSQILLFFSILTASIRLNYMLFVSSCQNGRISAISNYSTQILSSALHHLSCIFLKELSFPHP